MKIEIDLEEIKKNGIEPDSPLLGVLISEKYSWLAREKNGEWLAYQRPPKMGKQTWCNYDSNVDFPVLPIAHRKWNKSLTKINRQKYKELDKSEHVEAANYLGKKVELFLEDRWVIDSFEQINISTFFTYRGSRYLSNKIRVKVDE